jgi:hypothetical protein
MDAFVILYVLYQLLWLWEACGIMFYAMWKAVIQPFGKFQAVRLQERGGKWFYAGTVWKKMGLRKFAVRKGESHTVELDYATAYSNGVHPVSFYNIKKTRPLMVTITEIPHDPKKKPASLNPDSDEFDQFATREGHKQELKANSLERPSIMILVVAGFIGAMAMYIFYPFLSPPVVHDVATAITTTVTATTSVVGH